jgi:hypothetical protein
MMATDRGALRFAGFGDDNGLLAGRKGAAEENCGVVGEATNAISPKTYDFGASCHLTRV